MSTKWSKEEEQKFKELLQLYGNDWNNYLTEFPNRSLQSIKSKYHNEIIKLKKLSKLHIPVDDNINSLQQPMLANQKLIVDRHGGYHKVHRNIVHQINDDIQCTGITDNTFIFIVAMFSLEKECFNELNSSEQ